MSRNYRNEYIVMERILNKIMDFISHNENVDENKYEIVKYGLELFILKITFFIAILIVSIILNSFWEYLVFFLLFYPIRSFAGGYHASTKSQCFIQSLITVVLVLIAIKSIGIYHFIIIPLAVLTIVSAAIIWKFAPIDSENKRLDEDEHLLFKKKSRIVLCTEIGISLVMYLFGFVEISCSAMSAIIVESILMIMEIIKSYKYI